MPSTRNVPWFRIAAEGAVVVASILLAFAIDARWDERLERSAEREELSRLQAGFSLGDDWMTWTATKPVVVLEPETAWEGADLAHETSVRGFSMEPVRQLRDPALFEADGRSYLLYSVAGESGIAIGEIRWTE